MSGGFFQLLDVADGGRVPLGHTGLFFTLAHAELIWRKEQQALELISVFDRKPLFFFKMRKAVMGSNSGLAERWDGWLNRFFPSPHFVIYELTFGKLFSFQAESRSPTSVVRRWAINLTLRSINATSVLWLQKVRRYFSTTKLSLRLTFLSFVFFLEASL